MDNKKGENKVEKKTIAEMLESVIKKIDEKFTEDEKQEKAEDTPQI